MMEYIIRALWTSVFIVISVSIVIGNGFILLSIVKFRKLRTFMYVLVGNLAVSDLLVGVVLIPYYLLVDGGEIDSGKGIVSESKYACLGKISAFVICLGSSCLSLLYISIERFASLTYPLKMKVYITRRKLSVSIVLGWLLVIANGTVNLYAFNNYSKNNNTRCVSDEILSPEYKILINWELITGLTLNFIMYAIAIRISYKRVMQTRNLRNGLTVHARTDKEAYHVFTAALVFGTFLFCWLPYICAALATTFYETPITQQFRRYTLFPGLINSSLNWIIYGFRNHRFRKSFKSLIKCYSLGNSPIRPYTDGRVSQISQGNNQAGNVPVSTQNTIH